VPPSWWLSPPASRVPGSLLSFRLQSRRERKRERGATPRSVCSPCPLGERRERPEDGLAGGGGGLRGKWDRPVALEDEPADVQALVPRDIGGLVPLLRLLGNDRGRGRRRQRRRPASPDAVPSGDRYRPLLRPSAAPPGGFLPLRTSIAHRIAPGAPGAVPGSGPRPGRGERIVERCSRRPVRPRREQYEGVARRRS
jgi:hypothetical protein